MRITNAMMSNRMLLNLNRNMYNLDELNQQISSTKKIQAPSDNPILAARALKFRTNVSETGQYQRNVDQGLSWMSSTDKAYMNTTSILDKIRELCVQGASGENTYEERDAIATNINQLLNEIGTEMNVMYAGRYVFSGYRTDEPPVYESDNNRKFNLSQYFDNGDLEMCKSFQKLADVAIPPATSFGDTSEPIVKDISVIKLAYKNSLTPQVTFIDSGSVITPTAKGLADSDAYMPADNGINFIAETGELVLGKDIHGLLQTEAVEVNYDKTGFQGGDLNPMVYFPCKDLDSGEVYDMMGQSLQYEFGINTRININSLAKDTFTDKLSSDLKQLVSFVKTVGLSNEDQLKNKILAENPGITNEDLIIKTQDQLTREKGVVEGVLREKYNNMLGLLDKHFSVVSTEETDLGSRMKRLELISDRLKDDYVNYTELQSQNEDTDMVQAAILRSSAMAAYDASLKVGSNIVMLTLADFIR